MKFSTEEYLNTLVKLHTEWSTLDSLSDNLNDEISSLGIPDKIEYDADYPEKPGFRFVAIVCILPVIFLLIGLEAEFMPMVTIPGLIIAVAIGLYFWKVKQWDNDCENIRNHARENYKREKAEDDERVAQELIVKKNYVKAKTNVDRQLQEVEKVIDALYDYDVIYEKYQWDIVAICMFYEYLSSGRCEGLKGHGGAYDTYEYEIRMEIINDKLDDIIERLDDIADTQYQLYNAICEISSKQDMLLDDLENIASTQDALLEEAELTRYNAEVTAYNTNVIKYYELFR